MSSTIQLIMSFVQVLRNIYPRRWLFIVNQVSHYHINLTIISMIPSIHLSIISKYLCLSIYPYISIHIYQLIISIHLSSLLTSGCGYSKDVDWWALGKSTSQLSLSLLDVYYGIDASIIFHYLVSVQLSSCQCVLRYRYVNLVR